MDRLIRLRDLQHLDTARLRLCQHEYTGYIQLLLYSCYGSFSPGLSLDNQIRIPSLLSCRRLVGHLADLHGKTKET
jgi:hypothetical protein